MANASTKNRAAVVGKTKADDWGQIVLPMFAGLPVLATKLQSLSLREQIIFVTAVLDAGLVQLISHRLNGPARDIDEFLGTAGRGDAKAPCGSFGSRIQLGRLIGVIATEDVKLLRAVKSLRNHVAHAVEIELESEVIARGLLSIWNIFKPIQLLTLALVEMAINKTDSPLFLEFEKTAPDEWQRFKSTLEEYRPQWQEKIIQPLTAIYNEYRKEKKIGSTEWPMAVLLSSMVEHVLSSGTNVKASATLFFPIMLIYYKARFDFALRNTKPVESPSERFNLLSPKYFAGAFEPIKKSDKKLEAPG